MTRKGLAIVLLLISGALTDRLLAQSAAAPAQPLVVTAVNLSAREAPRGKGASAALQPGDTVHYRLVFTNTRPDSVQSVRFNDPIPPGLRYVAGSATADRANVVIEFSTDSGRTYSARPEIEVILDGVRTRRPAPTERYTHVRWNVAGWVPSRGTLAAEFKVQLPAPAATNSKE